MIEARVAPLAELPLGAGRAFAVADEQVAVFRLRDGTVRAVAAVCPHAGGPIADGLADLGVVVCPLHQHVFDLATGRSSTGQPPLRCYPVRVDDAGEVFVSIEEETP